MVSHRHKKKSEDSPKRDRTEFEEMLPEEEQTEGTEWGPISLNNRDPVKVIVLCLNVLAWEKEDADHFVSYDVLEDVLPYLHAPPRWTFRDSTSHILVPGDPSNDNGYTTDVSVEAITLPQEYVALKFTLVECSLSYQPILALRSVFFFPCPIDSQFEFPKLVFTSCVRVRNIPADS
jgi:hypothetical protein